MIKIIIGLIIAGVVGVGGYAAVKSKKAPEVQENQEVEVNTEAEVVAEENNKKMAFSTFLRQGGSYKCSVKQAMSDFENEATVYASGDKMRIESSTVAEGRPMDTSIIMRDGYSYMWSSGAPNMGFKMKVAGTAGVNTNVAAEGTYQWNANQIGDYNCEAWTADESKFTLPTSVKFTAMGAQ